jgi:hypothetical protein
MIVAVLAADGMGAVDIAIGMAITFDAGFFIVAFEVGILHSCFLLHGDASRGRQVDLIACKLTRET